MVSTAKEMGFGLPCHDTDCTMSIDLLKLI
jgi:hypothetical protein